MTIVSGKGVRRRTVARPSPTRGPERVTPELNVMATFVFRLINPRPTFAAGHD